MADRIRENEALKMVRFKEGLMKISEAYLELANKCAIIFGAQKVTTLLTSLWINQYCISEREKDRL